MRIKSPFKDYYDSCITMFPDDTPFYLRRTKVIKQRETSPDRYLPPPMGEYDKEQGIHIDAGFGYVGFCGKLYPFYFWYKNGRKVVEWNAVKLDEIRKKYLPKNYSTRWNRDITQAFKRMIDKEKERPHVNQDCIELKTPVYVWDDYLTVNPKLSAYNFGRMVHPQKAIQEIYMYLNGPLMENKEPPQIMDDKTIQYAKGFDHKYSFRKEPNGKRKNRKNR